MRHLLHLNDRQLSAHAWKGGRLEPEGVFPADDDGHDRFRAYLRARGKAPFRLLANVRDEDHRIESIPSLRGRDRQTLIARRASQFFGASPLVRTVSLGLGKTGRRDERLLLSALSSPELAPWLEALGEAGNPLAGVYSVSQLGAALLERCRCLPERCLLLGLHGGFLRESFISGGETLFSRLTPLLEQDAEALAGEAGRLRHYLLGQGHIGRQETLPLVILADLQACEDLRSGFTAPESLAPSFLDVHAVAGKLGFRLLPPEEAEKRQPGGIPAADLLFLHLLALAPPRRQYAGHRLRREYRLGQIRRWLLAGTAVALAATLPMAARGFHEGAALREEAARLASREAELLRRHAAVAAGLPQVGVDYETLGNVTARLGELQSSRPGPAASYQAISRTLDRFPAIDIDTIDWKIAPTPAGPGGTGETLALHGAIRFPAAAGQGFSSSLEKFIDTLEREASFQSATRLRDALPGQPLRNGMAGAAPFALELVRSPAP